MKMPLSKSLTTQIDWTSDALADRYSLVLPSAYLSPLVVRLQEEAPCRSKKSQVF